MEVAFGQIYTYIYVYKYIIYIYIYISSATHMLICVRVRCWSRFENLDWRTSATSMSASRSRHSAPNTSLWWWRAWMRRGSLHTTWRYYTGPSFFRSLITACVLRSLWLCYQNLLRLILCSCSPALLLRCRARWRQFSPNADTTGVRTSCDLLLWQMSMPSRMYALYGEGIGWGFAGVFRWWVCEAHY